jgi:N-acetylglucosamine-6-phosphate deacetylase
VELIARHYETGDPVGLSISGGRIVGLRTVEAPAEGLPYLAPGLFDLQINGYGGVWFSDEQLTVDQVLDVLQAHFAYGVTRLCPTLITNSFDALAHGFSTIRAACEKEPWAARMVAGCHLEGPYISSEDGPRGAHPLAHVRGCNLNEFQRLQEISGNRILLVTLAPEASGAVEFTQALVSQGLTVSIGHTAANSQQITDVVNAGARLSTHLGNGAHGTLRRHPNYIWDQLGEPRLAASIISDGHHLPPSVVRSILFAKGPRKLIITCDASGLAGCAPGVYDYHGASFEVLPEGKVVIAGQQQYLAGSAVQTDVCVAKMVQMTGVPLATAWKMASENPALLLGCEPATLNPGAPAELVLFSHDPAQGTLQVLQTVIGDETVYTRSA